MGIFKFGLIVGFLLFSQVSHAYTVNIAAGTRSAYLRVGDGATTGSNFTTNARGMANLATINTATVTVPAIDVGNNAPKAMVSNATVNISHYDGYVFCNLPGEVYLGAFYRRNGSGGAPGSVTVSTPTVLTNTTGDTIPISEISWTSSGNGDNGAQPFLGGTFSGGTQTLISGFTSNIWRESCLSFSFANTTLRAAGTYTAVATYTLAIP